MPLETIYSLCSLTAIAGWIALLCAPFSRETLVRVARIIALILCVGYIIQMLTITESTDGNFQTLAGVTQMFTRPGNVMMGWTHYLAFDLFIGSWAIEDAGKRGIHHGLMVPVLALTFMLGPIGLLSYFIVRTVKARMA
jgi:hypothetical protein